MQAHSAHLGGVAGVRGRRGPAIPAKKTVEDVDEQRVKGIHGGAGRQRAPLRAAPRVPAPGLRTRPPQCPCACSRRPPPRTIFRGRRAHTDGRPRGTAKPLLKALSSVFQSLFRKIVGAQRSNGCLASFGNPGPHYVETPTKVRAHACNSFQCTGVQPLLPR